MARILLTVPAWNEALCIERNLQILTCVCEACFGAHEWTIEVADNGSTDQTSGIVRRLMEQDRRLALLIAKTKGKGGAIMESWSGHAGRFDAFVFLDADLAADLKSLIPLVTPILQKDADAVCGSRFHPASLVVRSWWREWLSRWFRAWQQWTLHLPVEDAQCGFKAVSPRVVVEVVPFLRERRWLFDAELLAYISARGWNVLALPVSWVEHRDARRRSALSLWRDGWEFVWGVWRIKRRVKRGNLDLSTFFRLTKH